VAREKSVEGGASSSRDLGPTNTLSPQLPNCFHAITAPRTTSPCSKLLNQDARANKMKLLSNSYSRITEHKITYNKKKIASIALILNFLYKFKDF
jgi:hypothetical protein